LRNAANSSFRALRNRRWRSAFVFRFSSADLAGRPARSDNGKSTAGVNIFRRLKASGARVSASVRNVRLSPPSSKIGSSEVRHGANAPFRDGQADLARQVLGVCSQPGVRHLSLRKLLAQARRSFRDRCRCLGT
jgi:hypothetical protein